MNKNAYFQTIGQNLQDPRQVRRPVLVLIQPKSIGTKLPVQLIRWAGSFFCSFF